MICIRRVYLISVLLLLAIFAIGCVQQSKPEVKEVSTPEEQGAHEESHTEAVVVNEGEPSMTVNLKNFQFEPSNIETEKGQIVEFKNIEGKHTVTILESGHDEPLVDVVLTEDQSVLVKFNEQGSYDLVCRFHENAGMVGKIVVI